MPEYLDTSFFHVLQDWPMQRVRTAVYGADQADVDRALSATSRHERAMAALLSPAAESSLETMAQGAAALTRQRFGRILQFYAPLYVSNYCVNACVYCGFNCRNDVGRRQLTVVEAVREARHLAGEGFQHLLLVSGESRLHVPVEYFEELVGSIRGMFSSLSIEIYPMLSDEYMRLVAAGVDSLALYQETYDPTLYAKCHPAGPKRDYRFRLETIERGANAGITFLGIGALLGLTDWRLEAFYVGLHAVYLQRTYWRSQVSVSFPRMREAAGGFAPPAPVSDRNMVQMLTALRLCLPDAGMVLSTREPAPLRDALTPLGITRTSAGSRTAPGAYTQEAAAEQQFEVADHRDLAEMMRVTRDLGLDPVCKDWDRAYHQGAADPRAGVPRGQPGP